jgi:hypothetical protein
MVSNDGLPNLSKIPEDEAWIVNKVNFSSLKLFLEKFEYVANFVCFDYPSLWNITQAFYSLVHIQQSPLKYLGAYHNIDIEFKINFFF